MPSAVNIDLSVIKKISCPQSVNDLLQLHVNCVHGRHQEFFQGGARFSAKQNFAFCTKKREKRQSFANF